MGGYNPIMVRVPMKFLKTEYQAFYNSDKNVNPKPNEKNKKDEVDLGKSNEDFIKKETGISGDLLNKVKHAFGDISSTIKSSDEFQKSLLSKDLGVDREKINVDHGGKVKGIELTSGILNVVSDAKSLSTPGSNGQEKPWSEKFATVGHLVKDTKDAIVNSFKLIGSKLDNWFRPLINVAKDLKGTKAAKVAESAAKVGNPLVDPVMDIADTVQADNKLNDDEKLSTKQNRKKNFKSQREDRLSLLEKVTTLTGGVISSIAEATGVGIAFAKAFTTILGLGLAALLAVGLWKLLNSIPFFAKILPKSWTDKGLLERFKLKAKK